VNTILILIDSLNKHYLSAYGDTHVHTPNLQHFADKSWRFDNHFVGSLPCMPARREIFSGFKEMMWRPWGPLELFDERLPRLLEKQDYTTAIVTDHYHYWEQSANGYIQSFQSAELIRGHEVDTWKPDARKDEAVPAWVENIEKWRPGNFARSYYGNVRDFKTQEDYFPAKVMTGAVNWLENYSQSSPFFLQVESFDVHEPFHVPEPYASMYGDPALAEKYSLWPPYQNVDDLARYMEQASPEALEFVRAQYAGKLTMVDRWFGELMTTFDHYNLWDDTMIIITTDHGHDLGERGVFGKQFPHWDSHANIPMFIWHPNYASNVRSIAELTQTIDLFATILDAAGAAIPERTHSRSAIPLLAGNSDNKREAITYGFFGQGVCCTDGEWTYIKSPVSTDNLYSYSSLIFQSLIAESDEVLTPVDSGQFIPGVDLPQWKIPIQFRPLSTENFLFHRAEDPDQTQNLWDSALEQRQRMENVVREIMHREGAPPEQFERLGLSS
jgi:arylsulfatase A-like enzyme